MLCIWNIFLKGRRVVLTEDNLLHESIANEAPSKMNWYRNVDWKRILQMGDDATSMCRISWQQGARMKLLEKGCAMSTVCSAASRLVEVRAAWCSLRNIRIKRWPKKLDQKYLSSWNDAHEQDRSRALLDSSTVTRPVGQVSSLKKEDIFVIPSSQNKNSIHNI